MPSGVNSPIGSSTDAVTELETVREKCGGDSREKNIAEILEILRRGREAQ
jgi:hypothetical protein